MKAKNIQNWQDNIALDCFKIIQNLLNPDLDKRLLQKQIEIIRNKEKRKVHFFKIKEVKKYRFFKVLPTIFLRMPQKFQKYIL